MGHHPRLSGDKLHASHPGASSLIPIMEKTIPPVEKNAALNRNDSPTRAEL